MGVGANLPFALAPGMGLNAFLVYQIILGHHIPWQQALGMTFLSAALSVLLSLSKFRGKMIFTFA